MAKVIEQTVTYLAGAIDSERHVIAMRDGFIAALPFMIIGSFLLMSIFPPFSPDSRWRFARS